jgi:hypothetical protein
MRQMNKAKILAAAAARRAAAKQQTCCAEPIEPSLRFGGGPLEVGELT